MINFQNANHKILKMFFQAQKLWSTSANLFLGQRTEQNDIKSVAKYFVLDSASVKLLREISLKCYVCFHASLATDTWEPEKHAYVALASRTLLIKHSLTWLAVSVSHIQIHTFSGAYRRFIKTPQSHHKELKELTAN